MEFAVLNEDGSYGYQVNTAGNVQWDANNFCTAAALVNDGKAEQFRVVALTEIPPPDFDPITEMLVRDGGEFVDGRWQYKWRVDTLDAAQAAANSAAARSAMAAEIDAAVAAITARYAPFLEEYKTREMQARTFAAAGYTGDVPTQVAAFATPAGLSPQVATLTIIGQADALRAAQDALGVLRMRKYEVLRAASPTAARVAYVEVMAGIRSIAAGLS